MYGLTWNHIEDTPSFLFNEAYSYGFFYIIVHVINDKNEGLATNKNKLYALTLPTSIIIF